MHFEVVGTVGIERGCDYSDREVSVVKWAGVRVRSTGLEGVGAAVPVANAHRSIRADTDEVGIKSANDVAKVESCLATNASQRSR